MRFADLLRAAWLEYERDRARYLAVAMIYYAGISLIPLLVLLPSGLGLLVRFWPTAGRTKREVLTAFEGYIGPDGLAAAQSLLGTLRRESFGRWMLAIDRSLGRVGQTLLAKARLWPRSS